MMSEMVMRVSVPRQLSLSSCPLRPNAKPPSLLHAEFVSARGMLPEVQAGRTQTLPRALTSDAPEQTQHGHLRQAPYVLAQAADFSVMTGARKLVVEIEGE